MSELIEHSDNENDRVTTIQAGESASPVSIKVYQDIYHQVTGRTEQIKQRSKNNLLVEFSELQQLHHKIMQLCDVHNIVAKNEVVTVFHAKERKEQFSSFERFCNYNSSATSPTVSIVLKYNFSIIPSGRPRPQEYVVSIRLSSRVAAIKELEDDSPSFMSGSFFRYMTDDIAEVTIEYSDYVIARGFLEAFDEWLNGCKTTPNKAWLTMLRRVAPALPRLMRIIVALLAGIYAIKAIPEFFGASFKPEIGARFFVIYSVAAYIIIVIGGVAGNILEEAIDKFPVLSYLKLNRGDEKLIVEFQGRSSKEILRFLGGVALTIILGVISAKLEKFI